MKALTLVHSSFSSICLWLLFGLSLCSICFCNQNSNDVLCIPSEQLALIDLKNNFTDPANRLSSWVGKDCCTWSGVVCDNITGHVHEIHLRGSDEGSSSNKLQGTISPSVIELYQLRYLDLSCNDFGMISIPAFIGSLQNLTYLNISRSGFGGEIPYQLGNLTTLRVLDLYSYNELQSGSLKWLKNLKGLQLLDISGTDLINASDWFSVISNLSSLLELHFSWCGLHHLPNIPTTVSFTSLIVLDLSDNYFDGMLPAWIFSLSSLRTLRFSRNTNLNSLSLLNGLSSLSNLRVLDASDCGISVPVLSSLHNLSFIEYLDLSRNQIVEEIPKSFRNHCNFTTLDLNSNKFYGNVSRLLETFSECSSPKLEVLALSDNNLTGQLPERLGELKSLTAIDLNSNQLTGSIPNSLGSVLLLNKLDISTNQLSGSIPDSIGSLTSLVYLDLSNNKLNGSLPQSIGLLGQLSSLVLENNTLTGIVTENHFAKHTALETLLIGDNKLVLKLNVKNWIPPFGLTNLGLGSWSLGPRFPSWIQSQTNLTVLDLSNANISDLIPNWFWTAFPSLNYLNISHNNIEGKLRDLYFYTLGAVLDLSNNRLHGTLPNTFISDFMDFLDVSNNYLSGSLQQLLCQTETDISISIIVLDLANNRMSGVVPDCWMKWESLTILNLEKNQLSGIFPSSLGNMSSLKSLNINGNRLSGNLPPLLLNSSSLVIIKLAENDFTGKIPSSIGRMNSSLRVLSLRSNKLDGQIPDELCQLTSVQILDLAHNNLSGNIPACFSNFSVISGRKVSTPIVLYEKKIPDTSLVTKGNTYKYSTILYQVTSIDLSKNKLFGSIPDELIGLSGLRFLNLSHNDLTGKIPNRFE